MRDLIWEHPHWEPIQKGEIEHLMQKMENSFAAFGISVEGRNFLYEEMRKLGPEISKTDLVRLVNQAREIKAPHAP